MKNTIVLLFVCFLLPSFTTTKSDIVPNDVKDELWLEVIANYEKGLVYWPAKGTHSLTTLDKNDNVASSAKTEGEILYKGEDHSFLVPSRITQNGVTRETPEFKGVDASKVKKWKPNFHAKPTDLLKALDKNNQANISVSAPEKKDDYQVYTVEQTNKKGKKVKSKFYVDPDKKVLVKVVTFGSATLGDAGSNYYFEMHQSGVPVLKKIEILVVMRFGNNKTSIKEVYEFSDFVNKAKACS